MHAELQDIVDEFASASARLLALQQRLAAEAWARRPAPERWSPGECVAHLNLTSEAFLPLLRSALAEARRDGRPAPARYRRDLLGWVLWRVVGPPARLKSTTATPFVPTGTRPGPSLVADFERLQTTLVALAREADGLPIDRVRIVSPFDPRVRYNTFAALSILARHQHRHLWQAERASA